MSTCRCVNGYSGKEGMGVHVGDGSLSSMITLPTPYEVFAILYAT